MARGFFTQRKAKGNKPGEGMGWGACREEAIHATGSHVGEPTATPPQGSEFQRGPHLSPWLSPVRL